MKPRFNEPSKNGDLLAFCVSVRPTGEYLKGELLFSVGRTVTIRPAVRSQMSLVYVGVEVRGPLALHNTRSQAAFTTG